MVFLPESRIKVLQDAFSFRVKTYRWFYNVFAVVEIFTLVVTAVVPVRVAVGLVGGQPFDATDRRSWSWR